MMMTLEPPKTSSCDPLADESLLLERMRRGDEAAYASFVNCTIARNLAAARRILGNDEEADDAVQDAYLSAFKSLTSFTGDSRLTTWLHRIVINAALMRLRARKARPALAIEDLLPRYHDDGHRIDPADPWIEAPQSLMERAEVRAMVRNKIEQLPDDYRTVIVLRDIEGLDTDSTACALGISAGAVKTRLHRARQALRTLLEEEFVA